MTESEEKKNRRISADLPDELISRLDELKKEWGIRSRGGVLKRLLEEVLSDDLNNYNYSNDIYTNDNNNPENITGQIGNEQQTFGFEENKALVLISRPHDPSKLNYDELNSFEEENSITNNKSKQKSSGIDLPGFVSKRSERLRNSLRSNDKSTNRDKEPIVPIVKEIHVRNSCEKASKHWLSLYGHPPGETVVEAAMNWLACDIWPHAEDSESSSFTWSASNRLMKKYCPAWEVQNPSFELVMVVAGVIEDPYASENLIQRIPTLIRRFVNKFRRSKNVTSFETIQSTMTVHGALRLLGLPTTAGSALTLNKIRDAYKNQALEDHPDSGGSTDAMRRVNEAYQLLKELYRKK